MLLGCRGFWNRQRDGSLALVGTLSDDVEKALRVFFSLCAAKGHVEVDVMQRSPLQNVAEVTGPGLLYTLL